MEKTLVVLLIVVVTIAEAIIHVNQDTHRIIDDNGRERVFHGVNVVVKAPPWIPERKTFDPEESFTTKDMQLLQEMGLNALRLGMMWPGVEPARGKYNYTYLEVARNITSKSYEYGIYTLLDMHQDALSAKLCGEGIPDWAVYTGYADKFPEPLEDPYPIDPTTGHPRPEDCAKRAWSDYYWAQATGVAFQSIYNNTNNLQESLAGFWAEVANYFKADENILGYELINEPWAGDVYANPGLLLPTIADSKNFQPMYDQLNKAIRVKDNHHCIFFEGITWDELTNGFDHVPGGNDYRNRSILSYHFYIPPDISLNISFTGVIADLKRLGCAGFMTEFGIASPNGASVKIMDEADALLQSWTGWDYKPYAHMTGDGGAFWYPNGSLMIHNIKSISRTYAQAVAGVTQLMYYNNNTQDFTLIYHLTNSCSSTVTEIYLNEALHYPDGFTVRVNPQNVVSWKHVATNRIEVHHDPDLPTNTRIQVDIKKK